MPQNLLYPQRDQPLLMPWTRASGCPRTIWCLSCWTRWPPWTWGEFRRRYRADGHGRAASGPEMMVALLLYGYCHGERSSRVITGAVRGSLRAGLVTVAHGIAAGARRRHR
jgi:hypothetical protein